MYFKMEMEKYIEICSIFGLKCLAENIVSIIRMRMKIKLDLFMLVEFCASSIIFSRKAERTEERTCGHWIELTIIY